MRQVQLLATAGISRDADEHSRQTYSRHLRAFLSPFLVSLNGRCVPPCVPLWSCLPACPALQYSLTYIPGGQEFLKRMVFRG